MEDAELMAACSSIRSEIPLIPLQDHLKTEKDEEDKCQEPSLVSAAVAQEQVKRTKRKRSLLTLQKKLEIIEKVKKGEKISKLAMEYGVGKSTVSDLKRQEDKIMSFISKSNYGQSGEERKTMRKPQEVHVEKAVFQWLKRERKNGNVITGPQLVEKAKSFYKQLYGTENDTFKASSGWLHRFKLRNGIKNAKGAARRKKQQSLCDQTGIQYQLDALRGFIHEHGLCPDEIYTVSINRLHWKALPFRTQAGNSKYSKCCLTVFTCVNATWSHKLRPTIIGRLEPSQFLTETNLEKLSFRYYHNKIGSVDSELFKIWFQDEFVARLGSLYPKALLLLDDSFLNLDQGQLASEDQHYICVSVHSNISFVIKSINNYLFETLKFAYRSKLVDCALAFHPSKRLPVEMPDLSRNVSLKDAGYLLSEVWDSMLGDAVKRFWMDTLYCLGAVDRRNEVSTSNILQHVSSMDIARSTSCENENHSIERLTLTLKKCDSNVTEKDVSEWMALDGDNGGSLSDRDIVESVLCELTDSESEDKTPSSTSNSVYTQNVPSNREAYTCFKKCLRWLESQEDCDGSSQLLTLWKLQNSAAKKALLATGKLTPLKS